jgi:transcriptional regulator with XRE-family HTH domain
MTLNEKIHKIRLEKGMSQAELAFKTEYSIDEIKIFEINDKKINGFILLKIIKALDMSVCEFENK